MADSRPTVLIVDVGITVFGGVERVLLNVMPLLNRRWRVIYCDLWSNREYAGQLRSAGIEILHLLPEARWKYIGKRGSLLRVLLLAAKAPRMALTLLKLRRWLRRHRPDAVYFNRFEMIKVALPVVPGNVPCVYHSHGLGSLGIPPQTVKRLNQRFFRTIAVSQSTLELLVAAGLRREKLARIYNAIDADAVRHAADACGPPLPQRTAGDVIFLHTAVINQNKGQHVAIEAIGKIPDPSIKLWICGDIHSDAAKPYREMLVRRVSELRLGQRVTFLGWRSDVARVMAATDVIILPSGEESFGMALVEGMALGKPCIGTSRGGVPEVVADGLSGLIREPTPEAFADAMITLAHSSELRERMGQEASRRVAELFALPRQAAAIADVLDAARAWKQGAAS
jgi:glycosyltransferase involved in cell wall biosynthesis